MDYRHSLTHPSPIKRKDIRTTMDEAKDEALELAKNVLVIGKSLWEACCDYSSKHLSNFDYDVIMVEAKRLCDDEENYFRQIRVNEVDKPLNDIINDQHFTERPQFSQEEKRNSFLQLSDYLFF